MGIHFYFCIVTKNIKTTFKMNNKVLLPLFTLFLTTTNAVPIVQNNENENKVITKSVPAQGKTEELLYTVECNGPCGTVSVKLEVNGDADMFTSKQHDVSWFERRFGANEILCSSRSFGGSESCPSEITENEFFVLIPAFKEHSEGTLTITGKNLAQTEQNDNLESEGVDNTEYEG